MRTPSTPARSSTTIRWSSTGNLRVRVDGRGPEVRDVNMCMWDMGQYGMRHPNSCGLKKTFPRARPAVLG